MRNLLKLDVCVCTSQNSKGSWEKGRDLEGGEKQREGNGMSVLGKQKGC